MSDAVTPLPPLLDTPKDASHGPPAWLRWGGLLVFVGLLFLPGVWLADDRYWLPLYTRYMALALFALSVDLVWGYTGLLSLGQGLYFGLGAYCVGYSLKLQAAALAAGKPLIAAPDMALPDYMEYCRLEAVPGWIAPLINIWLALALAVLLPTLVAAAFGFLAFQRRIKGVYFSLITQALLLAVFTLVDNQQPYTGGRVGMVNLAKLELFGHRFTGMSLYLLITGMLAACTLLTYALVQSKVGKVLTAIRDSEYRVLSLGYNTALYKTFIFALAGGIAGLAGALYVSALGTAGPDRFSIPFSIEVVIFVAVGGRGTLVGAIAGAGIVNGAKSYFTQAFPEFWLYFLGLLFILVTLFLPQGVAGLAKKLRGKGA
jgi:urea transport system permease protein